MSYIDEILSYVAEGNAIIPCRAENKRPLTEHGFYDGTTDADQIREWWQKWPTALVGRPEIGQELAIDVDRQHGGFIPFKEILKSSPVIQETFSRTQSVGSRSGGGHIKFLNPANYDIKSAGSAVWKGIDFKTAGKGYLIVPPSPGYTHLNTSSRLVLPREFWELYQAAAKKKQELQDPTLMAFGLAVPGDAQPIPEGQRNLTLISIAGSLRHKGLTEESIYGVIFTENECRCIPPLPLSEVQSIVRSVMRYESGPLYLPPIRDAKDAALMISQSEADSMIGMRPTEEVRPVVRRLCDIVVKDYEFFWFPYMAFGTVTALSAKGGTGKGTLTNFLVALATSGRLAELGRTDVSQPLTALIFSKEDNPGAKMRPEITLAGGNIDKVFVCDKLTNGAAFTFRDAAAFDEAFAEAFADKAMGFVVDNAGDFGDNTNDGNSYKAVTQELTILTDLAQKYNVAVLLIMHENRTGSYMGSAAYENKVRSHCSYKKTDEENVCILTHEKKNFFHGKPMLFGAQSVDVPGMKYPVWKVSVVGEANSPQVESSIQHDCTNWLRMLIKDGPVSNVEINEKAEERGFSKYHVSRARTQVGSGIFPVEGVNHTAMLPYVSAAQLKHEIDEV
jgi:hypothetical protein